MRCAGLTVAKSRTDQGFMNIALLYAIRGSQFFSAILPSFARQKSDALENYRVVLEGRGTKVGEFK